MTGNKRGSGSDLSKADAYVNTALDYEEVPELDDAFFDRATSHMGGKPIGRPPVGNEPKQAVSLRLDRDVVAGFKAGGPGWQTRMNDALRAALKAS